MEFKTHYGNTPARGIINTAPSQTIPGHSYTVREIQKRYSQGLGWDGPKVPIYDGGEDPLDGIDLNNLDLSEREQILSQVNERIIQLRHSMAEAAKPNKLKAPQATMDSSPTEPPPAPVEPIEP